MIQNNTQNQQLIKARVGPHMADKPLALSAVSQQCQLDSTSGPHLSAMLENCSAHYRNKTFWCKTETSLEHRNFCWPEFSCIAEEIMHFGGKKGFSEIHK